MSEVEYITIPPDADGQRLDRWLKKRMSFAVAQKLIRTGQIRLDGKRAKPDARLSAGQELRLPPLKEAAAIPRGPAPLTDEDKALARAMVFYDDGDVLVLNKPYDMASQGGTNVRAHVDRLLPALKGRDGLTPKLVHRLDKETSGLMLLARQPETVRYLGRMFRERDVKKIYWAILVPAPVQREGTVRAPIGKSGMKDKMRIDEEEGKYAVTDFRVLETAGKEIAFAAFWPRTGRTHQIRVHAAEALECPILGDGRYGGEGREQFEGMGTARRLHLHARRLVIHLPGRKEPLDLTAPLPDDLRKSWKALGFDPDDRSDPFEDG